jgi:hypothetical protein
MDTSILCYVQQLRKGALCEYADSSRTILFEFDFNIGTLLALNSYECQEILAMEWSGRYKLILAARWGLIDELVGADRSYKDFTYEKLIFSAKSVRLSFRAPISQDSQSRNKS